ncbi:MAG: PEGA domain-containing protein [Treponema sp.]|jgi:hypothetical protein|nr:PEGA domain-containing protein [Treponema sp.]
MMIVAMFFIRRKIRLLVFLFAFPLAAQSTLSINSDRVEAVAGRGLLVRTKPTDAKVYIDGIERGKTPLTLQNIRSGEYVLRVSKTGYRDREMKIRISQESRLELDLELEELAGRVLIKVHRDTEVSTPAAFSPELFVDGEAPREYEFSAGGLGSGGYRNNRSRSGQRFGEVPGTGIYLVRAVQASSALWEYELRVPAGFRQLQVRAFGWEDARATVLVEPGRTSTLDISLRPAAFLLSGGQLTRPRFNPLNAGALGTTGLSFQVSAPGTGRFSVTDEDGQLVYSRELSPFSTWSQQVVWNGRDQTGEFLGDGVYTLRLDATVDAPGEPTATSAQSIVLQAAIDSSLLIYPLSLFSAMPGLFFAPSPAVLPPGSFQVNGGFLFGQIPLPGIADPEDAAVNTFSGAGVPFELAFRFSPLKRLELAAAVDSVSHAEPDSLDSGLGFGPWGFSLSTKWLFLPPSSDAPLSFALLGNFSWSSGMDKSPQREGASLIGPFSWDLGHGFSLLASPGLQWPDWDRPDPRLLLSLGPMFRRGTFSAGLSLRSEFDFSQIANSNTASSPVTLFTAGELTWSPPPSLLVLTLLGGFWNQGTRLGGFGGVAVGAIF